MDKILQLVTFKTAEKKIMKYKLLNNNDDDFKKQSKTVKINMNDEPFVLTTILDNKEEVKRIVKRGDFIVTGLKGEQYAISPNTFFNLYNIIGNNVISKPVKRTVAEVTSSIFKKANISSLKFTSSWGEEMILEPGDYLVKDNDSYYRIEKDVFKYYKHKKIK